MKHNIISLLMGIMAAFTVQAQEVNYSDDIASIIYQHCSNCHRPNEIGPFSLTNYEEVKNWGSSIRRVTTDKIMPPWQADPNYNHLLEENYLTDHQIEMISQWVNEGMPRGSVTREPVFPDFPSGSVLGEPDLVLEMSEAFLHKGNNRDNYRYFVLPTELDEDKVVKAIEFRPGNSKIVHHALLFEDNEGIAKAKDEATSEYGFNGFGSFLDGDATSILSQKQFPGYVPGQKPIRYPDGIGQILKAGSDVVIQVHYAPWPVDEYDQSKLNIFFADESEVVEREVDAHIMVPLPSVIRDIFLIPANSVKEFHGYWEVPEDLSLTGITPHMHLLGQHWEVYLEHTDGSIDSLIRINEWDFNWQGSYSFNKYIIAEQGSTIHAIASYDNTSNNPNNPRNPPRIVTWGEGTTDEMYYLPINFVKYQTGDEDIVFDDLSTATTDIINIKSASPLSLYPNPSSDYTTLEFELSVGEPIDISIFNTNGQLVKSIREQEFFNTGKHSLLINVKHLNSGNYITRIKGNRHELSSSFIKL